MSAIKVSNLTFGYDSSLDNIFENVSFVIDTNWKLGFIGRNGKGKTTFLNLLLNKYEYYGKITSDVSFDYFPFKVDNVNLNAYEIARSKIDNYQEWKLEREISLMNMDLSILTRKFSTLSKGEQTKVLLAIMFLRENNFLLIDEPTNHLDIEARKTIAEYLKNKKGFILVSHDRKFLDTCVDHILSINKSNIEVQQGNFSSWYENKMRQDNFELSENEKLKKDIDRLEKSAKQSSEWANEVEESKHHMTWDGPIDKGFIGHKSAKMMKRAINAEKRKEKAIEEKSKLLKNIERVSKLKLNTISNRNGKLIEVRNLSIYYDNRIIFDNISFSVEAGQRVQLFGKNGCGKSSIIKLLLGEKIDYKGDIYKSPSLKISYISQDTSYLKGSLSTFIKDNNIDETLFKSILRKLDFMREHFDKNMEDYSEGQKKKVLLAKSICEEANLYIWDEPLNYIDIFSRMQIEDLILEFQPTMIFVEHDEAFSDKIATDKVYL